MGRSVDCRTVGEVEVSAMVRLLHTADWQIGMTRSYLPPEAQQRLTAARTEVVRRIGTLALEQGCDLVVVAGDVFEHNQLTPQTVRRALEALREVSVPVYLLPGNHDHLGPMSVWSSPLLREELPGHVHVLDTAGVVQVAEGVELVAAPWTGKHPVSDPVAGVLDLLPDGPAPEGTVRIVVGHGGVDLLDRDQHNTAPVAVGPLASALDDGRVHYVALGDRHSCTQVGDPAIWYSGAPEPTDWREQRPGEVLVVDVEPGPAGSRGRVEVRPQRVARWTYRALARRVDSDDDLEALDRELGALPDKERTVLRLGLHGTLGLAQHARLEEILERHADLLAALHRPEQHNDVVLVGDDDLGELGLGGFLASALEEIRGVAAAGDGPSPEAGAFRPGLPDDEGSARDALSLLYRLTRGGSR
ncbi:metallophosphoesterase family protein [Ornithinimicrobium sufpigmenti]|uniref:metallophosphoesterase family protein n=1 Tax=Ornithinimicrobium sufpigmenti TaxID=2508882 RepID=UPI001EDD1B80|nr:MULTISPECIES: exonuclease SbcCD subunit D [unclassified Ornithinimicrobium]